MEPEGHVKQLRTARVCIFGAGAVGGSMAVRLAHAGAAQVTVIARGEHGQAIAREGLTLISGEQRIHARVRCVQEPAQVRDQDVVVVAVKSNSLAAIAASLPLMVRPGGLFVFAMNGLPWWFFDAPLKQTPDRAYMRQLLDPQGLLERNIPLQQTVGCVVSSSNEVLSPGLIFNSVPQLNRLVLGRPGDLLAETDEGALRDWVAQLVASAYDAKISKDLRSDLWAKMLLAVSASPVAALTGRDLQVLVNDVPSHALITAAMQEALSLGRALGLTLQDDVAERLEVYRQRPTRPSLLQDAQRGRPLEINNGLLAFAEIARELNHPAPTLQALATLVRMKTGVESHR